MFKLLTPPPCVLFFKFNTPTPGISTLQYCNGMDTLQTKDALCLGNTVFSAGVTVTIAAINPKQTKKKKKKIRCIHNR